MPDEILWTAGFFNERFPAPVSPLAWSMLGPLIEAIALRDPLRYLGYPDADKIPLTRLWRGHPYANALAFQIFYKIFPDFLLPEDTYRYFRDSDTSIRKRAPYPRSLFSPRLIFSMLRAFLSDPHNFSPLSNYRKWAHYTREHDRRVAALRAQFAALARAEPHEIFAALREAERAHRDLLRIHRWSLTHADLMYGLLKRLTRVWLDPERASEIAAQMVVGMPNKTLEVDAALRDLAARARGAREHAATFQELMEYATQDTREAFTAFLFKHGHRSFSLDIAISTFADEPMQVVWLMRDADESPKTKDEGLSFVRRPSSRLQRWLLNAVRSLAVKYIALREDQRYYWQKSLAVSRHLYLLLADRLAADGVIADRNAIFYATHQELEDYFSARLARDSLVHSIAARQAEWREYEQSPRTAYPAFLRGDIPLHRVGAGLVPAQPAQWRGRAISPGKARGATRVVQSADHLARVQRGEILVAPATDPAWTPVFARIAGLVVERGGVLSHSAVVAREYGIPAVAGIPNIVAEIREGEVIEVDGSTGVVTRFHS